MRIVGADSSARASFGVRYRMTPAETLAKAQRKAKRTALEDTLVQQIRAAKLDAGMVREHRFVEDRRWRFDLAWPERDPKIAVEVEGGTWINGRHNRGAGIAADMEKYNRAAISAWYVMRVTAEHIRSGQALAWIQEAMKA
jgi:hypothetical protein